MTSTVGCLPTFWWNILLLASFAAPTCGFTGGGWSSSSSSLQPRAVQGRNGEGGLHHGGGGTGISCSSSSSSSSSSRSRSWSSRSAHTRSQSPRSPSPSWSLSSSSSISAAGWRQQQQGQRQGQRQGSRRPMCRTIMAMAEEPDNPTFVLAVLGDLHLDASDMGAHEEAREHIVHHMEAESFLMETDNTHLVSLGDLGMYGSAGTTECFKVAKDYLDGFQTPVDIVSGNHDLEGLEEFSTDEGNLLAFQAAFEKETPQFSSVIADKTLCLGLSTVRFRDAQGSSHEVFIDEEQMSWFEQQLSAHPASEGWKVLVFSHAPPMGSGLRVVQGVHIRNQCAWLNHSGGDHERRHFLRMCRKYGNVKAWFSGHFHLSHDYEDSISVVDGCAFVQVGVIGEKSTRDGRRQSRLVRGTKDCLQIFTVSHHTGAETPEARLDLTLTYDDPTHPVVAHGHEDYDHSSWFSAYLPEEADGCYLDHKGLAEGGAVAANSEGVRCWWHMEDGSVLGVHDGMVVEYDQELLAPIGVVRDQEQLRGREVMIIDGGSAAVLVPKEGRDSSDVEVIHPNAKGGYSTLFQRNKAVRTKEKEREDIAQQWLKENRS